MLNNPQTNLANQTANKRKIDFVVIMVRHFFISCLFMLLATNAFAEKADKEKPAVVERNVKAFMDTLRSTWQFLPRHFVTSAEKKSGREELLKCILDWNKEIASQKKDATA